MQRQPPTVFTRRRLSEEQFEALSWSELTGSKPSPVQRFLKVFAKTIRRQAAEIKIVCPLRNKCTVNNDLTVVGVSWHKEGLLHSSVATCVLQDDHLVVDIAEDADHPSDLLEDDSAFCFDAEIGEPDAISADQEVRTGRRTFNQNTGRSVCRCDNIVIDNANISISSQSEFQARRSVTRVVVVGSSSIADVNVVIGDLEVNRIHVRWSVDSQIHRTGIQRHVVDVDLISLE